jgi:hypothetical protein
MLRGEKPRDQAYRGQSACSEVHVTLRRRLGTKAPIDLMMRLYAVVNVNVNVFEGVPPSLLKRAAASFQEECEDVRLARRTRNWIASVKFVESEADAFGYDASQAPPMADR